MSCAPASLTPGDVPPYLALAIRLIQANGHRVRLATHSAFKDLVLGGNEHLRSTQHGDLSGRLEFFDVGGDPKELMAFMVKSASHSRWADNRSGPHAWLRVAHERRHLL